jgi:hypothetical protein
MSTGPTILDVDDQPFISDVGPVRERLPRTVTLSLLIGVLALLVFGPLAFGAVEPWAVFTIESGAALLLLFWTVAAWASPPGLKIRLTPLLKPMLLFVGVGILQIILGRSAYAYNTGMEVRLIVAYGILAFLTLQSLQRSNDYRKFGWTLAGFGFAVALFAVAQDFAGNGKIYWVREQHEGVIYGPYVNHSHFAGLMEMLMPFALVIAAGRMVHGGKRILLAFAAAFMVGTVFMSRSLGGVIAIACQVITFILVTKGERRCARHRCTGGIDAGIFGLGGSGPLTQPLTLGRRPGAFRERHEPRSHRKRQLTHVRRTPRRRLGIGDVLTRLPEIPKLLFDLSDKPRS